MDQRARGSTRRHGSSGHRPLAAREFHARNAAEAPDPGTLLVFDAPRPGDPRAARAAAERRRRGAAGERAAEALLRKAGLVILARNWRGAGGEIDLVALEGETIVFVEVKSRSLFDPARPAVRAGQRRRIAAASRAFRARFGVRGHPCRFDLVTVEGDEPSLSWRRGPPAGEQRRRE
jgi:putative endonuclease